MPELPEEVFVESVRQLVAADRDWFPTVEGGSLYLRPFMFASEAFLGVRPAILAMHWGSAVYVMIVAFYLFRTRQPANC